MEGLTSSSLKYNDIDQHYQLHIQITDNLYRQYLLT